MRRNARVVTWNGKDIPTELRELPAGRYVVEAIDDATLAVRFKRRLDARFFVN